MNPGLGNLVENIEDWEFSSFLDYSNKRKGSLINKEIALQTVNYDIDDFKAWFLAEIISVFQPRQGQNIGKNTQTRNIKVPWLRYRRKKTYNIPKGFMFEV